MGVRSGRGRQDRGRDRRKSGGGRRPQGVPRRGGDEQAEAGAGGDQRGAEGLGGGGGPPAAPRPAPPFRGSREPGVRAAGSQRPSRGAWAFLAEPSPREARCCSLTCLTCRGLDLDSQPQTCRFGLRLAKEQPLQAQSWRRGVRSRGGDPVGRAPKLHPPPLTHASREDSLPPGFWHLLGPLGLRFPPPAPPAPHPLGFLGPPSPALVPRGQLSPSVSRPSTRLIENPLPTGAYRGRGWIPGALLEVTWGALVTGRGRGHGGRSPVGSPGLQLGSLRGRTLLPYSPGGQKSMAKASERLGLLLLLFSGDQEGICFRPWPWRLLVCWPCVGLLPWPL